MKILDSHTYLIEQLYSANLENEPNSFTSRLNFNHPCKELLWSFGPTGMSEEQINRIKMREIKIKERQNAKKDMEKAQRQVSKARKLYRKFRSDSYLEDLHNKEALYRQFYNIYWYDYAFVKI